MRRFCVAVLLLLLAAPSAVASGPRARDFERTVPGAGGARAASAAWTSPAIRPGRRFSLFGVRWARGHRPRRVEARVHDRRIGWRRWVELGEAHSARGTDPAWAGGADAVQLRVRGSARGLRLHFVSVRGARAVRARAAQAQAQPGPAGAPTIVPRSEWEGGQCKPRDAPTHGEVKLAFVHHTVNANDYGPEDSQAMVLAICRYHRNSNGWDDVGYNFLVDKYGTIFEGRAGGIDQAIVGAQAQGFNSVSTGIANLGTYQDVPQSDAALEAMARLIAWKLPLHGAPVEGQVTVTSAGGETNRYPSGRAVTFERISGHRDGNSTECPGDQLYAQLPRLRELAAGRAPAATPPPPPGGGTPVALTLAPAVPAFAYPQPVQVSGRLTDVAGAGVADRRIKVEIGTSQGWRDVTSTTTAADGSWTAQFPASRTWDVRAIWNDVASPRMRVVVAPVVTAALGAPRVRAGRSAVVTGTIRPQRPSVLVEAWRQVGASKRYVKAFTLRARARNGRFRLPVGLRRPGLYRLRVRFGGDRRNGPAQAGDLYVRATRGPTGGTAAAARAAR